MIILQAGQDAKDLQDGAFMTVQAPSYGLLAALKGSTEGF